MLFCIAKVAKVELHHASENKHFAGENKVLKSIDQATAYWAYYAAHLLHDAQSWVSGSKVLILNHVLPRNFDEFVAKRLYVRICLFFVLVMNGQLLCREKYFFVQKPQIFKKNSFYNVQQIVLFPLLRLH